jgi:hypothetical protein
LPNAAETPENAFLVIAPGGRDAQVLAELLASARLACVLDHDGDKLLQALTDGGAAGAIITDGALARIGTQKLREAIERQPPWSDFPFVLLSRAVRPGRDRALWKILSM